MIVGVNFKLGIAYATTDKLMTNRAIRKALLLPFWMTGILPASLAFISEVDVLISLVRSLNWRGSGISQCIRS